MKFKLLLVLLISAIFLTGCVGTWFGTGKVIDKSYVPSHLVYYGKNMYHMAPACHQLTVRENNGDEHTGCVKGSVWDAAEVGKTIVLNEQTRS